MLDLHGFTVREALRMVSSFLYVNRHERSVDIVTGRGRHSKNGIPRIKPAVEGYVRGLGFRIFYLNEGCMRVFLN